MVNDALTLIISQISTLVVAVYLTFIIIAILTMWSIRR